MLTELESKRLVQEAGVPVARTALATSVEEAREIAASFGFPVVVKVSSPDIVHKSDVGGVRVGVSDDHMVTISFAEIMTSVRQRCPNADVQGIIVQEYAPPGIEVIVGSHRDEQFGPVVMVGLGGTMVELFNDVAVRVVPLTEADAIDMLEELRTFPLLAGFRGSTPLDVLSVQRLILSVSELMESHPEVHELDLNPVLVYPQGVIAVDAAAVVEPRHARVDTRREANG